MAQAVVVGGGIGGLAAARGLQLAGWSVRVLEQAATSQPLGAGISLWPNAVRALQCLQVLLPAPEARAGQASEGPAGPGGVRDCQGRWLSVADPASYPGRYGAPLIAVHRGVLQQALLDSLLPGTVVTDTHVETVEPRADGVLVTSSHGVQQPDLVVLADGLSSATRHLVAGPAPRVRYAGYTAWRGVTKLGADLPDLAAATESWGQGKRFGLVPLADGRTYWFATANTLEGQRSSEGEHAEVLRRFAGWHSPIGQVLRATNPAGVLRHDVYDLRPHPTRYVSGRLVLLGDAAHAMTPNLGQGACQALEDAATLGAVATPDTAVLHVALVHYDTLRRPRARRIATQSRQLGRLGQLDGSLTTQLRNLMMRATPTRVTARQLDHLLNWQCPASRASSR